MSNEQSQDQQAHSQASHPATSPSTGTTGEGQASPRRAPLKERLEHAVQHPERTDEGFDPLDALAEVLESAGLAPSDSGGTITFVGRDPIVPSVMRLGAVSALGMTAKAVALAAMWRQRGGEGQDITVDLRKMPHRLCPFYDGKWEKLAGYPGMADIDPSGSLTFNFYQAGDGRWVMPLNPYPKLRDETLNLLNSAPAQEAIAAAVKAHAADDLERSGDEAGVVMPMLRTTQEFIDDPVFPYIAGEPLIKVEKIGDSEPEPLPSIEGDADVLPLTGVRALGMGHVIAGAGIGRDLAYAGADVLNIWRPDEFEHKMTYISADAGTRSILVDPYTPEGKREIRDLLKGADVFYANRRPGYLEKIGLTPEQAIAVRPGLVYLSLSLGGEEGPWANRVGFDQTAGALTGIMLMEGPDGVDATGTSTPQLPYIGVVNDYVLSWLSTTGIVAALLRRAREGGSYKVSLNLTRVAAWIISLGLFDREYAYKTALNPDPESPHSYHDPDTFRAHTALGEYQGVTDQIVMSKTPGRFREALYPRGGAEPKWLDR